MAFFNGRNYQQPQIFNGVQQQGFTFPQVAQPTPSTPYYIQPVSSIKEAEACSIPMDGSIVIFPDRANGKIYTKKADFNTGQGVFQEYALVEKTEAIPAQEFATISQLNDVYKEIENVKNVVSTSIAQIQTLLNAAPEKPKTANKGKGEGNV